MPQVVVAAIAVIIEAISVYEFIFVAAVAIYAQYQSRKLKKKAASQSIFDGTRGDSFRQPITNWRMVFGQIQVGGPITFVHATDNNTYLNLVVTLAAHEVQSIGDVFFNDERIPQESNGRVSGRWDGFAQIYKGLGSTAGDSALLAALQANCPGVWTSAHKQEGRAKLYVRFKFSQELFRSGLPQIRAVTTGRKLFDPRSSSTIYSNNWALAIRSYLTDSEVGLSAAASEIDDTAIITAANVSDEYVTTQDKASDFAAVQLAPPQPSFSSNVGGTRGSDYSITFTTAAGQTLGSHTIGIPPVFNDAGDLTLTLTNIPIGPAGVTGRKIYRDAGGGGIGSFGLVGTLSDNTTTSFVDDLSIAPNVGTPPPIANTTLPVAITLTTAGQYMRTGDKVRLTTTGTLPSGLATGTDYYYVASGGLRDQLATSLANARAATAIAMTSIGSGTHTVTRKAELRYVCDGTINTEDKPRDILGSLLTAGSGKLLNLNGKWTLYAGAYRSPSITLDENDLDGNPQVTTRLGRSAIFNAVKGVNIQPEKNWQPDDFPPVTNATYLAEDNNERIWQEIELPYTLSASAAQRIAKIQLEQARQQITTRWPCKLSAFRVQAGDVQNFSNARFGWNVKPFEIIDFEFTIRGDGDAPRLGVDLFLRETASTVFDWNSGEETTVDPAPDTNLPNPFDVDAPVLHTPESGTAALYKRNDGTIFSRILVSWDAITNTFVREGGRVEIRYRRTTDAAFSQAASVNGDATFTYILDVQDTVAYIVGVRAVNNLGARSDWVDSDPFTVVGLTEPPPDIVTFTIEGTVVSWSTVDAVDLAGYRLKYQPGTSRSWGDAILLHEGLVTSSPYDLLIVPGGPVTISIKAVDTSGNESQNAAYIVANLGDPLVANVVETFDRKAAGFPGTKTNCSVSGGNLVADSITPLAWKADDSVAAWSTDSSTLAWATVQYAQMTYVDSLTFTKALAGSQLTIQRTIQGDPWSLEYRENSPKLAWSGDDTTLAWNTDDTTLAWDSPPFLPWPGQITVKNSIYDFRIIAGQANTQGVVSELTMTVDAPDIDEILNDIVISAGGTRLPITKSYTVIKNVQLTAQADGGGAITARTDDKDPTLGPLVHGLDAAGANTSALVDAHIQGY